MENNWNENGTQQPVVILKIRKTRGLGEFKKSNFKRPIEHSEDGSFAKKLKEPENEQGGQCSSGYRTLAKKLITPEVEQGDQCSSGAGIFAKKLKTPEDEQGDQCSSSCGTLVKKLEAPEDVEGDHCSSGSGTVAKKPEDEQGDHCSADLSLDISEQHSTDIWPSQHSINELPDEMLLMIMKHLNPDSLTALGWTCRRMNRVCRDRKLWTEVEISCTDILRYCDSYSMAHITKVLRVVHKDDNEDGYTGPCVHGSSLAFAFSVFNNLEEVYMRDHYIDEESFRMSMLPPSLRVLCFAGSSFKCWESPEDVTKRILRDIRISTPNIEEMNFASCSWLVPVQHFIEFSKMKKLRKLIIRERKNKVKDAPVVTFLFMCRSRQ